MFQPKVLHPEPDPFFVRELRKIDPALRVSWAYERYLKSDWVIEREIEAERYFLMYESVLSGNNGPRFVPQPIFDTTQPIFDDEGQFVSYRQVGVRDFDLAPRNEWVAFARRLDGETLTLIREAYWEHAHPEAVAAARKKEEEDKRTAFLKRRMDAGLSGVDEAFLETRKKVQFGRGETRNER